MKIHNFNKFVIINNKAFYLSKMILLPIELIINIIRKSNYSPLIQLFMRRSFLRLLIIFEIIFSKTKIRRNLVFFLRENS